MPRAFRRVALLTLGLAACSPAAGNDPVLPGFPGEGFGITAVVGSGASPIITLGDPIPVTLLNRSGSAVIVGALDCVAEFEIVDPKSGRWYRIPSLRLCIEIAVPVAAGADHRFVVPAPESRGRYRVVFEGFGGPEGQRLTIRSNRFDVE